MASLRFFLVVGTVVRWIQRAAVVSYSRTEHVDCVVIEPTCAIRSVIWLHGLGADGHDFVPLIPELRLSEDLGVRFVFPHAALRPVTINNGYVMRAWDDIMALALTGPEDELGIRDSERSVRAFIEREMATGVAAENIVLAGFSQGGALALHTALRYPRRLAGVLGLSTYLPLRGLLEAERANANRDIPVLLCHGQQDSIVPYILGEQTREHLERRGYRVEWRDYPIEHEVSQAEIGEIARWLTKIFSTR